ncbi:hypothetical protein F5B22DRAFT_571695 [Xylaria bambusicola]|uniref:uncharacterized protein n=1 Tax=Xylaria bambusicola TaxID=326684 RepID=UPI002008B015|nr:uncharacterized protein F5B22DRAFT_571695 [Xylaria bambusicola]KAI0521389.1 hypothetical protein F5B22DRAFT_571695 [Xylaria bambusicola]
MESHQFSGWAQTLHDDSNTENRLRAIESFENAMKDPVKWKKSWADGGGTAGILHLMSTASVREVKVFCKAIRACNRRGRKSADRERAIDELVKALLPQHYRSTKLRTRDKRPLQKYYSYMLRGCSSSFVEKLLTKKDKSNPLFKELNVGKLLFAHDDMLRRRLTDYLLHNGPQLSQPEMDVSFRAFVFQEPPFPGTEPNMSASMQYALELLQAFVTGKRNVDRWPRSPNQMEILMSVYRRFVRRRRSADRSFFIKLGFQLIQSEPAFKSTADANVLMSAAATLWKKDPRQYESLLFQGLRLGLRGDILPEIAARWKDDPDQFEHLLTEALGLGLGGHSDEIGDSYLRLIRRKPFEDISSELRWRLLCLFCQHTPQDGVKESSDFTSLANQEWPFELFDQLDRENSIFLLKGLYSVNPNFDFLRAPRRYTSIYAMQSLSSRRNFNVDLLLTTYQWGDSDVQQKVREEVDQLRKTAATTRDQNDRALFAKAAAHLAIATGDLESYAETLVWQKRFIRDSIAIRKIFAKDALLTSEGLGLLSGIDLPVADGTTPSAIAKRLARANEILKSVNDTARMAKKEPSNNHANWTAFQSFYTDVYSERVSRAKKVKLELVESELDMFHIIWSGTTELAHSIGSDFMSQIQYPVLDLLSGLSGASLIAAAETLLDFAAKWGRKGDRNEDHDNITATMELLSFQAVSKLARADAPTLAQGLIQRAIIEFPAASSWHRQFLSLGYMKDLPASAAKTMLLSFASAIGEKLEEQSYVKVGDAEPPKHAPPASLVKVSTVKYLAQLLNNAEFIGPDSAIEVLIELFRAGTHIDVRLATLDSLLGSLNTIVGDGPNEEWKSDPVVEKILGTLEIVIPIAGNMNERRPLSVRDWQEAREKTTVPALSIEEAEIPPLLKAVLEIAAGKRYPNLEKLRDVIFSRLVLPTLHHSQEQHRAWFSLFLAKYRPALSVDRLPPVPITPHVWYDLLNHHGRILPSSVIDAYNQYAILRIRLPEDIQEFNESLQEDATLRNDANVNHWLSIFGDTGHPQPWKGVVQYSLFKLILTPGETVAPMTDLLEIVASQASALLDDYENRVDDWQQLVASLKRPYLSDSGENNEEKIQQDWNTWLNATHALSSKLVSLLEHKVASSGESKVLPSTFPLRVWGLPYPEPHSVERTAEAGISLVTLLDSFLASYLESHEADVLLWATLANDVYNNLVGTYRTEAISVARLRMATQIGDLNGNHAHAAPAIQLIKVAVALKLIDSVAKLPAIQKPKTNDEFTTEQAVLRTLIPRFRAIVDGWASGGATGSRASAGIRDMAMQWKSKNKALWNTILSWDSA